jgi:hypothetical protein
MRLQKKRADPTLERKHMSNFNAIDYTNELQSAGVPQDQAAVHANALIKVLADLAFSRDLEQLKNNLLTDISARFSKLEAEIAVLRAEIGSIRNELVVHRWVLGAVLALGTANLALTVKLALP